MSRYSRRHFLGVAGASAAIVAAPNIIRAQGIARVVVVGGGFAGATLAKHLRMWSGGTVDVLLVEKNPDHVSCIMSNLVLNERLRLQDLRFDYDSLQARYGVEVLQDEVTELDGQAGEVHLKETGWLGYDRLVLAPGIAFDQIPGWDPNLAPHAWIAGDQTNLLRDQLREMPDNGTFVMTIPRSPYRCPPGPYERACLVADLLGGRSGTLDRRGSRRRRSSRGSLPEVIVLDANADIQAEKETFVRAFEGLYGDIIQYHPNAALEAVDSDNRVAVTSIGEFQGDVLNVIPAHSAAKVVSEAGLTDGGRYAPVDALTYESLLTDFAGVHVIGDSQASGQPKSGHMANAQAKVCADAILRTIDGRPVDDEERMANITTNSACFSPITFDEASWLTAVFAYDPASGDMRLVPGSLGEAADWNRENFETMFDWSDNLFADTFA